MKDRGRQIATVLAAWARRSWGIAVLVGVVAVVVYLGRDVPNYPANRAAEYRTNPAVATAVATVEPKERLVFERDLLQYETDNQIKIWTGIVGLFTGVILWPLLVVVLLLRPRLLGGLLDAFAQAMKQAGISKMSNALLTIELNQQLNDRAQAIASGEPSAAQVSAAAEIKQLTVAGAVDLSTIRQQVLDLAHEYEHTRAVGAATPERTHKMEETITKMRLLALVGLPLLPELTSTGSVGATLAAIAMLQVHPKADYLPWLAARVAEDPGAFHGYHAAVAIRNAARALGVSQSTAIQTAIDTARSSARNGGANAFKVLDEASQALLESRTN